MSNKHPLPYHLCHSGPAYAGFHSGSKARQVAPAHAWYSVGIQHFFFPPLRACPANAGGEIEGGCNSHCHVKPEAVPPVNFRVWRIYE